MIIALAALTALAAFAWLRGGPPQDSPGPEVVHHEFDAETFMEVFDSNGDGRVTRENFLRIYDQEDNPFVLSGGPGKSALTGEEAFRHLDANGDGVITRDDFLASGRSPWLDFQRQAEAAGLAARQWKGRNLALNTPRSQAFERELGAQKRQELPFHGQFFDRKYFTSWARVTVTNTGETFEGYLYEEGNDRVFVLTPETVVHRVEDARNTVLLHRWAAPTQGNQWEGRAFPAWGEAVRHGVTGFRYTGFILEKPEALLVAEHRPRLRMLRREEISIEKPDSPRNRLAAGLRQHEFDNVTANLELARLARESGLHTEAMTLYMRVLTFEPRNTEALEYLGIRRDGHQYRPAD